MYYIFYITANDDVCMSLHANDVQYDPDDDSFKFDLGNGNVFLLSGDFYQLSIVFACESHGGHIDTHSGAFIVDYENGTDEDFDTHSVDVQNGEGYYSECGKYVSYHKDEL